MEKQIQLDPKTMEDVVSFIAEATEVIDNLVTGNNHTYEELALSGLIVKPIRRFMKKHKKYRLETQAVVNKRLRKEGEDGTTSDFTGRGNQGTPEISA